MNAVSFRNPIVAGIVALLLVMACGVAARALFPLPPQTYAGMLG